MEFVLRGFLKKQRLRTVHVASGQTPPPPLAYMVNFPRLSLTISGADVMWLQQSGAPARVVAVRAGQAVFVPPNAWNKPLWNRPVEVLSILFGHKQTGISLVRHDGRSSAPSGAIKTSLGIAPLSPVRDLLRILSALEPLSPVSPPLVESLLHCCMEEMKRPRQPHHRKGRKSFEEICLYIQEQFPFPITRNSVADNFRISPNHISRLFRREGQMCFNDYLNYVRIDRAKFLLARHHLTIDEVAALCGYHETAYFCRVFKQKTKLTPGEYRSSYGAA
jgi:AraC-like DNA-binding protein